MSSQHQHVAVHEDRPAGVVGQVRRQEAREGEIGRLQRMALAAQDPAKLREHERRDGDRLRGAPLDAERQHVVGDRLARVEADEDAYHVEVFRWYWLNRGSVHWQINRHSGFPAVVSAPILES